jgi:hypothetical protein
VRPTAQLTDKNVPKIDTDYTDDFKTVRSNEKTAALYDLFCSLSHMGEKDEKQHPDSPHAQRAGKRDPP